MCRCLVLPLPSGSQVTVSKHWVWGELEDTWRCWTPISKWGTPYTFSLLLSCVARKIRGSPKGRAWAVGESCWLLSRKLFPNDATPESGVVNGSLSFKPLDWFDVWPWENTVSLGELVLKDIWCVSHSFVFPNWDELLPAVLGAVEYHGPHWGTVERVSLPGSKS